MKRQRIQALFVLIIGVATLSGCMSDGIIGWSPYEKEEAAKHGLTVTAEDEIFTTAAQSGSHGLPSYKTDGFGVPYYARNGGMACSLDNSRIIREAFARVGGSLYDQIRAVYTVSRESGCQYWAYNRNTATRDDSYCAAQLNRRAGWFAPGQPLEAYDPPALLQSMEICAEAFALAWQSCGWSPWTKGSYGCHPSA